MRKIFDPDSDETTRQSTLLNEDEENLQSQELETTAERNSLKEQDDYHLRQQILFQMFVIDDDKLDLE